LRLVAMMFVDFAGWTGKIQQHLLELWAQISTHGAVVQQLHDYMTKSCLVCLGQGTFRRLCLQAQRKLQAQFPDF